MRMIVLRYGANNRLSAHTDTALAVPAPVTMTALYDGASRRVKQVAGGVTRYSVNDAYGTLIEIDEVGGAKTDYIHTSGMTLALIAGSTVTWLHHDHLGSVVAGEVLDRKTEESSVKPRSSRNRTFVTIVAAGSLGPMT